MFYSQFILAKKGPLGTIWIAAHLERKLRKNQVADTDIGVSVDSILFPDVPIALRLSSHLLLGVVRIYSRKVNYLFHDCSEALLKIKQAFRSTAVDLPPEESTAPYHSITLPETFDLDDFELPDSAFLQGNFVDHHVSTREQITLQDSVDGTGYSASQFGLDERFGDGDASQIRLDLDEDLFLDKNPSPQHVSASLGTNEGEVHQGQPSISLTDMDIDEGQNERDDHKIPETPKDLSDLLSNDCGKYVLSSMDYLKRNNGSSHRHGYNIQTPDLNEVFFPDDHPSAVPDYAAFTGDDAPSPDLFECAQAPSTPGLMEEAIPASVHEIPVLSPQEKTSSPDTVEVINKDTSISPCIEFEASDATNNIDPKTSSPDTVEVINKDTSISPCIEFEASDATNNIDPINDASMDPESIEIAQVVHYPTSVLTEPKSMNIASENSGGILTAPDESHLKLGHKNEDNLDSSCINSEVNNLQIVHDNTEAIRPEVTCLDVSSCSHEASNSETPLNRFTTDNVHLDLIHTDGLLTSISSHEASNLEMPLSKPTTYNVHSDVTRVDGLLTSSSSHELSDLATPLNKPTADDVIILTSNDKVQIPGMASEINGTSPGNKAVPSILVNEHHEKDVDSCLTSNTSALSSELYLRSCSLQLNQANVLSSDNATLVGNAPEFSHRELTSILEEPLREEALHVSGFSIEVQGEDNCIANVIDTVQELHRKEDRVFLEFKSGVNKPDAQSTGLISKDIQLEHLYISSNIHYPEPEKMLFASTDYVNPPHDLGQFTADKGVTESARNVGRIDRFSGKKRCLMDSTPVLEIGSSAKMSGLPRVRRNNAYIADDDDLLASILVGRMPNVRMGPTPPPSKVASRKRPRLAHKSGMSKRKVLLDDTMVLHADAIRQQLMNTEDIRRMRKKAPCTRPEIWMIHKSSMEEELFSESLFTGISTELSCLFTRSYDVNNNLGPQIGENHSDEHDLHAELSKEVEHSRNVEFVQESSEKEIGELITVIPYKVVGVMQGPSDTSVSIEGQSSMDAVKFDAQEKLESHPPQVESSGNNQTVTVSTVGINEHENVGTEMPMLSASNYEHAISTESRIEETFIHINSNTHSSSEKSGTRSIHQEQESPHELVQSSDKVVEMDYRTSIAGNASVEDVGSYGDATGCNIIDNMAFVDANDVRDEDTCIAEATSILRESNIVDNVHLNCPQDYHDVGKIENGEILVSMLDRCLLEDRESLPADSSTVIERANSPTQVTAVENVETTKPAVTGHHSMEESKEDRLEAIPEGVEFVERVSVDEERHTSGIVQSENPQVISSCPHQPNSEIDNVPSAVGEHSSLQEGNLEGGLEAENAPVDIAAARESSDFCDAIDDDATDFLNVEDEADFDEEEDIDLPNSDGAQLLENSGWSTRTRGVARYLKTLFDEDYGRGKKVVAVDHLLAGKTRKEASRMFFETLVLKTRDYIHVEQENPFECINIMPRPKILKSGL